MKIIFSDHSREQNKFRKIPLKLVRETIIDPDEVINSYKNRKMRRKKYKNRTLEVVTITEDSIITVITFYWLGEQNENIL